MHQNLPFWLLCLGLTICSALAADPEILIQGAPLIGGCNGMYFDEDNHLHVAQVYGREISKLNIDSGDIMGKLSYAEPDDLVVFPDDLVFGPYGTMYYTDPMYYQTVFARSPGGPSVPLLPIGSVPFANPVTLSEDGSRLFYAQCWDVQNNNSLFELNLETLESTVILEDVFGCASNAMAYKYGALYTPRPFEGRVVKVDLLSIPTRVTNVTTGMVSPNAVKFNSKGELFVTDTATGEVVLVNLAATATGKNRKLVAQFPTNSIDNLAFDKDDRLFVSSASDASVIEVLSSGELRIVSPEGMSIPMGLAVVEDTEKLYTLHPGALYEIDIKKSQLTTIVSSAVTLGPFAEPTSLVAWGRDLILMSYVSGSLMIWDLDAKSSKMKTTFAAPVDAHPFKGDLIVTETEKGRVVRAAGSDSFQTREVIAEASDAVFLFLTGDDNDVYVSDWARGSIVQVISNQEVLNPPKTIVTGLSSPEGIAMHPNGEELLVVDAGSSSLLAVDLLTGNTRNIASGLELMSGIAGFPFGYPNDVVVLDGSIYVNGDGANVIYSIKDERQDASSSRINSTNDKMHHHQESTSVASQDFGMTHVIVFLICILTSFA